MFSNIANKYIFFKLKKKKHNSSSFINYLFLLCAFMSLAITLIEKIGGQRKTEPNERTQCAADIKVRFIFISSGCQCAGNWEIRKYYTSPWLVNAHLNANTHTHTHTDAHLDLWLYWCPRSRLHFVFTSVFYLRLDFYVATRCCLNLWPGHAWAIRSNIFGKGSANCDSVNCPTLILIFVFVHL